MDVCVPPSSLNKRKGDGMMKRRLVKFTLTISIILAACLIEELAIPFLFLAYGLLQLM